MSTATPTPSPTLDVLARARRGTPGRLERIRTMADVMSDKTDMDASCTDHDLSCAGFTRREIASYAPVARDLIAQRRSPFNA